jgi:BirA family biotin operon repressor/biotin-[acetyl-CoA-carboxylase] ligase
MKALRLPFTVSTNRDCFNLLKDNESVLVTAERQTGGRGRNTNKWESPLGNIYLSVGKKTKVYQLPMLSQKVAVLIFDYLQSIVVDCSLKLKWPNDIFLNSKKVCGILVETKISGNDALIVIGVGINYAVSPLQEAVSIKPYTNKTKEDIELEIVNCCLNAFNFDNELMLKTRFNENGFLEKGDLIEFKINDKVQIGNFVEISNSMELVVKAEGEYIKLNSAEVRKIRKK